MSEIPARTRTVIIGGGAVGVSCLYHLALAGWQDAVLLERNELTAGSTWHAAGNVPTFSASWVVMNMQRYSTQLYRGLAERVDYPMNYHVTGSVRLAHSGERMAEFARARDMGRQQGMELELLGLDEIKAHYPFIETHDLAGGLYDPADGDIDPAQLTQALAKGARQLGAKIIRFCPATGIARKGDYWLVKTEKGDIECEFVVNAAGYYAQRVAEWFRPYGGRRLPMAVMSHQYLLSEEVPEIEAWSQAAGRKLPLLRDVDSSYYLRQEKNGFNLGPYERGCRAHWSDPGDPLPDDFSFQLFGDDLDRLEWYIEDAMARVPLLASAGISKVINGPIPYTPDGHPLIGPMPGVKNAFEACVFTFGIAQAGGAGKILAEWMVEGGTQWDSFGVDPRRFTGFADDAYSLAKAKEVYGHEYAMHFPRYRWPAAPNQRLSSLHGRLQEMGAQFGVYNGWERANWFAGPGDDTSADAAQSWQRNGPWQKRVAEECQMVADHVAVLDLPGFSRFNLNGPGADDWLASQIAGRLPAIGRMSLAYFPDHRGRIVTEMSVMRHAPDHLTLITAAAAQWHDFEWLDRQLPEHISLDDRSEEFSTLIVSGPASRALLAGLGDGDLARPWLSLQQANIAGQPVLLARVSFAGELGWEIHAEMDRMPAIHEALLAGGAGQFGMFALDSLRIEKGYRAWKTDLSSDYSLIEAGLDRFIDFAKPQEFAGKAILAAEKSKGPKQKFITLKIEDTGMDAPPMSSISYQGEIVGAVTSSAYGNRVGALIGLGMMRADLVEPGRQLAVDIFGQSAKAWICAGTALWDPANERLKA